MSENQTVFFSSNKKVINHTLRDIICQKKFSTGGNLLSVYVKQNDVSSKVSNKMMYT